MNTFNLLFSRHLFKDNEQNQLLGMKDLKGLISISKTNNDSLNEIGDKFELLDCSLLYKKCTKQLPAINKHYAESHAFYIDKNFQGSMKALKRAFYITTELQDSSCLQCTKLFRSTIIQSLKDIHLELENMTKGIFKTKRYQSSQIEIEKTIKELENIIEHDLAYSNN